MESRRKKFLAPVSWIWLPWKKPLPNQYVCFRKQFKLGKIPDSASIDISAYSDFIVYMNGVEIGRGQFSDYPERKTFSRFKINGNLLKKKNVLGILAYFRLGHRTYALNGNIQICEYARSRMAQQQSGKALETAGGVQENVVWK